MHCKSSFWSLVDVDVSAILNPKFVITFNVSNFYKLLCFAHIFERNVEKEKHGLNFAVVSDSSSVEYLCVNNWLLCVVLSGLCEWKVKLAHVNLLINSFHPVITSGTNNNSVCSIIIIIHEHFPVEHYFFASYVTVCILRMRIEKIKDMGNV